MQPVDRSLIEKYINGQCTPEEEERLHTWLDSNDSDKYASFLNERKYKYKEQLGWKRLASSLEGLEPLPVRKMFPLNIILRYAAVLAFLTGIWAFNNYTGGILWWNGEKVTTDYGETKQIYLEDGSVVILNAMSELKISNDFGKDKRELYLIGEGYFKVQKDKIRPFIVYSNGISTKALGTQFNVSAYPDDKKVIVSLQEGKVEVKKMNSSAENPETILLTRGEEVTCHAADKIATKTKFTDKDRLSWRERILYFNDEGIEEVLGKLERFYGVSFEYSALKGNEWRLNGEYKNQSLKDVLESLSFNYNIHYQIKGNTVILSQ
ncbi:MAG TPA: FecR domain-containing protein [Sphingobacteriaceae bacterium]